MDDVELRVMKNGKEVQEIKPPSKSVQELMIKGCVYFPLKVGSSLMRLPSAAGAVAVNLTMGLAALIITGAAKAVGANSSKKYFLRVEKAFLLMAGVMATSIAAWDTLWSGNWNARQFRESYNRVMATGFAAFTALSTSDTSLKVEKGSEESNRILIQIFDLLTKSKRKPPSAEILKIIYFFVMPKPDFEVEMANGSIIKHNLKAADLELTSDKGKIMKVGGKLEKAVRLQPNQIVQIQTNYYEVVSVTSTDLTKEGDGSFAFDKGILKVEAGKKSYTINLKGLKRTAVADRQGAPVGNVMELKNRLGELVEGAGLQELKDGNFGEAERKANLAYEKNPEDPIPIFILALCRKDRDLCKRGLYLTTGENAPFFLQPKDFANLYQLISSTERDVEIRDMLSNLGNSQQFRDEENTYAMQFSPLIDDAKRGDVSSCDAKLKAIEKEISVIKRQQEKLRIRQDKLKNEDPDEFAAIGKEIENLGEDLVTRSSEWAFLNNMKKLGAAGRLNESFHSPSTSGLSDVLSGDPAIGRGRALLEAARQPQKQQDPRLYFVIALSHAAEGNLTEFLSACDKGRHFCTSDKERAFFDWLESQKEQFEHLTARFSSLSQPLEPTNYSHLGELFLSKGYFEEARAAYSKADDKDGVARVTAIEQAQQMSLSSKTKARQV